MSLGRRDLPRLATSPYVGPLMKDTLGPGRRRVLSWVCAKDPFVVGTAQSYGPGGSVERELRARSRWECLARSLTGQPLHVQA